MTALASSSLFSGLTEAEIQEIQTALHGERRAFEREEFLLRAGEPTKAFGVLLSGGALVRQEDFWGNRNILSSLHPGDCFAETFACLPGAVLNVDVTASQPCEALFLKTERLLSGELFAFAGGHRFFQNFLINLAAKNLRLNEKITHMGRRSTRAKVLSYLSSCARRQGGAGLGLSICAEIIKRHGGRLDFQSEEGKGTLVRVWLPEQAGEEEV